MDFQVNHAPTFSTLQFELDEGESVIAQPNSMLTMTEGIRLSARAGRNDPGAPTDEVAARLPRRHSWFGGLKNLLTGENFFTAEFTANADSQQVVLAPESYGDLVALELAEGTGFYLTSGSYLANVGATSLQIKYGGLKSLMSKKGLFLMHATGVGHVFCQSFGAVVHRQLEDGESLFVDNRFMIAFSDTVTYKLVKATDKVSDSLMSGEGLINRYTGPGHLYYQTRSKPSGGILSTLIDAAF
ncbi:TIGR00266 family protein [Rhodopirellula sp. MGV]|uniref:TIGR00266 family protein n=1 Tax=Rhodopirellula sp. MGV TaxID=2023130 RepID=UPI000B97431A|nr:TIGR00266 family protein [Rhodopirellula sp. MGV]OYP33128.1 TIGR00266 family protein [Rhodopirellula sp. MGV]PNY35142.1 TIGR00266 family protein [Rhodopirellula baltica]